MKQFALRELREARAYAMEGGQALHLMDGSFAYLRKDTPGCFKGQMEIAHLFDQDKTRLIATAKRFGVRVIKVEREGTESQHIDLCRGPLVKAKAMCDAPTPVALS
jgi:hypothetical protein